MICSCKSCWEWESFAHTHAHLAPTKSIVNNYNNGMVSRWIPATIASATHHKRCYFFLPSFYPWLLPSLFTSGLGLTCWLIIRSTFTNNNKVFGPTLSRSKAQDKRIITALSQCLTVWKQPTTLQTPFLLFLVALFASWLTTSESFIVSVINSKNAALLLALLLGCCINQQT